MQPQLCAAATAVYGSQPGPKRHHMYFNFAGFLFREFSQRFGILKCALILLDREVI